MRHSKMQYNTDDRNNTLNYAMKAFTTSMGMV